MGAYIALVDRALAEGQSLFPAQVGPVGVVTDLPPVTPAPPGISGTRSGALAAAGHYAGQWKAARIADDAATAAANEAAEQASAGRAAATSLRMTAQAQAVAMAPAAEAGPVGMRALVAAMNEKLAAMQHLIETSDRHNQQLASRLRNAADIHERLQPAPLSPPHNPTAGSTIPPVTTAPEDVKEWWESKSQSEKDSLIGNHPDEIGNLDGIPSADRDLANRTMMNIDLAKVEQAATDHRVSIEQVKAQPLDYGLTPVDVTRYDNATKVQAGLDYNSTQTRAETFLLTYKPEAFNGQGRAAIAINNPDKNPNVAIVVPGTSHSVATGWLSASDASNLYAEMQAITPGQNSIIAWMGYDAPDSLSDPRIASTPLAHQGAGLLSMDLNGLKVTNEGDSHFTLIGHSYGSTVVADAAWTVGSTGFVGADDVVLIGSPGTDMAKSAADFHLPAGGHVYVGSASTDPITQLGQIPSVPAPGTVATLGLGPDPSAENFGATRFRAEAPGITWNAHSHYYVPGSESARSLGLIASGHGDQLHSNGLTAPPRPDFIDRFIGTALNGPLGALPDPELTRIAADPPQRSTW